MMQPSKVDAESASEQLSELLPAAEHAPTKKPFAKLLTKAISKPISIRKSFEAFTEELIVESTRQGERERQNKALSVPNDETGKLVKSVHLAPEVEPPRPPEVCSPRSCS